MATVHSYARFSHASQALGDSIDRQDSALMQFVKEGNHTLSDLRYLDKGKTAFKGNKQKHLNEFLSILRSKDGRIKKGDILYCEAIDRLSRKGIRPTQEVVNEILGAGVDIAINLPVKKIYHADKTNDLGDAIELAAFAFAAHTYSELLSGRVKGFHKRAREAAVQNGKVIESGACPSWLERSDGKFTVKQDAAKTIRLIFKRVVQGMGGRTICKELNENYPCFGRSNRWNETFVRMLTSDRRIIGEYQPHETDEQGKRIPIGDPITGYFPAILTEEEFVLAARARRNRLKERGPSGNFVNLFTGLVFHAIDKCPMNIVAYQQRQASGKLVKHRRLISQNYRHKVQGTSSESVEYEFFEQPILKCLRELDLSVFSNQDDQTLDDLAAVTLQLDEKKSRLAEIEVALTQPNKNFGFLMKAGEKLQNEIDAMQLQMDDLRARSLNTPVDSLRTLQELTEIDDTNENRQLLREAIKRIVRRIVVLPVKLGSHRSAPIGCHIEIEFLSGMRRSLLQLNRMSVVYTDPSPTRPNLIERKDHKTHIKKLRKALTDLFLTPAK